MYIRRQGEDLSRLHSMLVCDQGAILFFFFLICDSNFEINILKNYHFF